MKALNDQQALDLMSQNTYYYSPKGVVVFSPTEEQETLFAEDMDEYVRQARTHTGVFAQAKCLKKAQYLALKAYSGNTFKT